MWKDIFRYFNQNKLICTELQTTWKISYSLSATKYVVFRKRIIEDNRRKSDSSNIVQTGRKKFAFLLGSKLPPPLWFGENLFQIPNGFRLVWICVFLLVGFLFCFLCGNKTKSLHRLMLAFIFVTYPIQKTFSLWLNLLRFLCTFFFLAMIQQI